MSPQTAIQWALIAAEAASKVLDQIQDGELRAEANRQTREMLSDEKLRLRAAAQEMLDKRKRGG